jgi:hypothetical protein
VYQCPLSETLLRFEIGGTFANHRHHTHGHYTQFGQEKYSVKIMSVQRMCKQLIQLKRGKKNYLFHKRIKAMQKPTFLSQHY